MIERPLRYIKEVAGSTSFWYRDARKAARRGQGMVVKAICADMRKTLNLL